MSVSSCIKFCSSRLHQLDPTHDCFINSVKCVLPFVIGTFCWVFFRKPFTFWIILLPMFAILVMTLFTSYKLKFYNMLVFLSLVAVLQFVTAVLNRHYLPLIVILFIISFPFVASIKYRYVSVFAILCAVIYIELPGGWYAGTNQAIEVVIAGIIAFVLQMSFEYCTSILRMRATIIYFFELIADAFYAFTADDINNVDIKISNKYLFERPLAFNANFIVEKIYKSNREKFIHRVLVQLVNKGKVINNEEHYFKKNKDYRDLAYPMFIYSKRMFRNVTFMLRFHKYEKQINELLPSTNILIPCINDTLKKIITALRFEETYLNVLEDECVYIWLNEHKQLLKTCSIEIEKEVLEFIYGKHCLIHDIRQLAEILNNRLKVQNDK